MLCLINFSLHIRQVMVQITENIVIVSCIVFLSVCNLADGFGSGAPLTACRTMKPLHLNSRDEVLHYSVAMSSTTYRAGQPITLTVVANGGRFKGFLIEARRLESEDGPIGRFNTEIVKGIAQPVCANGTAHAITQVSPGYKKSLVLSWIAPERDEGDLQFWMTLVSGYNTRPQFVRSDVLTFQEEEPVAFVVKYEPVEEEDDDFPVNFVSEEDYNSHDYDPQNANESSETDSVEQYEITDEVDSVDQYSNGDYNTDYDSDNTYVDYSNNGGYYSYTDYSDNGGAIYYSYDASNEEDLVNEFEADEDLQEKVRESTTMPDMDGNDDSKDHVEQDSNAMNDFTGTDLVNNSESESMQKDLDLNTTTVPTSATLGHGVVGGPYYAPRPTTDIGEQIDAPVAKHHQSKPSNETTATKKLDAGPAYQPMSTPVIRQSLSHQTMDSGAKHVTITSFLIGVCVVVCLQA